MTSDNYRFSFDFFDFNTVLKADQGILSSPAPTIAVEDTGVAPIAPERQLRNYSSRSYGDLKGQIFLPTFSFSFLVRLLFSSSSTSSSSSFLLFFFHLFLLLFFFFFSFISSTSVFFFFFL